MLAHCQLEAQSDPITLVNQCLHRVVVPAREQVTLLLNDDFIGICQISSEFTYLCHGAIECFSVQGTDLC